LTFKRSRLQNYLRLFSKDSSSTAELSPLLPPVTRPVFGTRLVFSVSLFSDRFLEGYIIARDLRITRKVFQMWHI